jgi:hypothetical protein
MIERRALGFGRGEKSFALLRLVQSAVLFSAQGRKIFRPYQSFSTNLIAYCQSILCI